MLRINGVATIERDPTAMDRGAGRVERGCQASVGAACDEFLRKHGLPPAAVEWSGRGQQDARTRERNSRERKRRGFNLQGADA